MMMVYEETKEGWREEDEKLRWEMNEDNVVDDAIDGDES